MKEFVMRPEKDSKIAFGITKSKAKLYEYGIPEEEHIKIEFPLIRLIDLTLGILGEVSADFEYIDIDEEKYNLLFSARYFDAILNTRITTEKSDYLKILASSSYYLIGYPGNANVILKDFKNTDLKANELEKLIISIIKKEKKIISINNEDNPYKEFLNNINKNLDSYYKNGNGRDKLIHSVRQLKKVVRNIGNDRELLFADIINALFMNYLKHSVWETLPIFSNLDIHIWNKHLKRINFIKLLWPAQLLIGELGVLKGDSAIIQLPTSSGKTKSIELIIRSSFLSKRSSNAVIVAPLRSLCQEIYETMRKNFIEDDEIEINLASDVLQYDFNEQNNKNYQITILTPEKLDYILRQNPEISKKIGLIIYDEGHLIDDVSRGTKYELLLSALKQKLSTETQVILISAVIPNPNDVGKWLIGDSFILVEGKNLLPLNRSIAFAGWTRKKGYLHFMNEEKIDEEEFFVPNLLEKQELKLFGRERIKRYFPEKNSNHISLSLSFRLIKNGSIAIFVGQKRSAIKVAREAIDVFNRGLSIKPPLDYSDTNELKRLNIYIENLLGSKSIQSEASKLGIYIHHGSTPYGLRLALQYAISMEQVKFIICTSTLAQGVNLPIRYLIITTSRQGKDEIKIRDFHNLLGRAGRAGIYTEGSVIFSNNEIFDKRHHWRGQYIWNKTKELLDPNKTEFCRSYILTIFKERPTKDEEIKEWEINIEKIKKEIEKYLLIALEDLKDQEKIEEFISKLVKNTFAYSQANTQEKKDLIEVFISIAKEIIEKEKSLEKRKIFSKAIISINEAQEILEFLNNNISSFVNRNAYELLESLWPIIYKYSSDMPKTLSEGILFQVCNSWISGLNFENIFKIITNERIRRQKPTIDYTVYLCENIFGFEGSFIIGSCTEILEILEIDSEDLIKELKLLQKMAKYGLPNKLAIIIYELGINDRKLSLDILEIINTHIKRINRKNVIKAINSKKEDIYNHINKEFPSYFEEKFNELIEKEPV